MVRYCLQLINGAHNLDLTRKQDDIRAVFALIRDGGHSGRSFRDLEAYKIIEIQRDRILVDVRESGDAWHRYVGKFLANDYGMRAYCDPKDSRRMFDWSRIVS